MQMMLRRTWTYPAPKAKANLTRIKLGWSFFCVNESRGVERHGVPVRLRIVKKAPAPLIQRVYKEDYENMHQIFAIHVVPLGIKYPL
jgi:hypothetical protein